MIPHSHEASGTATGVRSVTQPHRRNAMKTNNKTYRPQSSKKLQLQRETVRHLNTSELASVRAGAEAPQTWTTFTQPDI